MEAVLSSIWDFIKVRQLNVVIAASLIVSFYLSWGTLLIASVLEIAATLTVSYLVYQYWGTLFRTKSLEDSEEDFLERRSRSRSPSGSRGKGHHQEKGHGRGRRYGRCPDCSKCNSCTTDLDQCPDMHVTR